MQVGLIGLGEMGFNLGRNLIDHHCEVAAAVENGYLYAGEAGSGHFLKMVHDGIVFFRNPRLFK